MAQTAGTAAAQTSIAMYAGCVVWAVFRVGMQHVGHDNAGACID